MHIYFCFASNVNSFIIYDHGIPVAKKKTNKKQMTLGYFPSFNFIVLNVKANFESLLYYT